MVDIKNIESAYKRTYGTKKINKKTKKWKSFYNAYRREAMKTAPPEYYESKGIKSKPMVRRSFWMNFNGKRYSRGNYTYSTKEEAIREAKTYRKDGVNTIIDKRKSGYFFWIRSKKDDK